MLGVLRASIFHAIPIRAFSTSSRRAYDLSKLTLVGTLARDAEVRTTKNDKEYVVYTIATTNYPPPPPDVNGERRATTTTWHRIMSFQEHSNKYLQKLKKGSRLYVEANYEIREPELGSDPSTPQGQRQIFLRHENVRLLSIPSEKRGAGVSEGESTESTYS